MTDWQSDGWLDGVERRPSPNFEPRPAGAVTLVVVHNISLPPGQFGGEYVEDFFLNRLDAAAHPYFSDIAGLRVSAHFYICRDGCVVQFVGCDLRAWHAGHSVWRGRDNCNDFSVGIELEGSDEQPFAAVQYAALFRLIDALRVRYPIAALTGHSDIAPGRKSDPGPHFDWAAVRARYPNLDLPPEVAA
ncbi:1,6-anhydro-N-acetylmuramyl-L-alanine amidase AmpD [Azonexus sp.]|jgi:AmpD protein|uniref:1,6-anhydro-N-acetylmuramyl-L-alanine amidase AmpD n=1 Tax=Azonexus sp. TaxID=1872668 RepID=UPI0028293C75|nr:1,6-anhydro-N-acetylmuramyl-L-alanine amidase AmpD [Azonexus sp.]MDR1994922.1 1,6-anhydro-N-acetylmuramyl-L-alanine amidase AmpD [Azonexus sp.]